MSPTHQVAITPQPSPTSVGSTSVREALLVLAVTVPLVYVTWAVSTVEQVVDSVATFVVAPASVSIAGTLWLGAFVSTLALRLWVGARSHLTHSNIST